MMLREELLRKVRLIEITTRKVVDDVMTGRYKSHFKGQGVQFSEHRQYVPGDDIRHIDWKASARTREPLIKKFEEERELSVLLIVDVSASGEFGSIENTKSEIAAEVAGMVAHAASHTGDKVGVIFFAGEVEKTLPLRKGRAHVQRIIRDILSFRAKTKGTNLAGALESANRVLKHSGIVFIVSDFIAQDFSIHLRRLSRKHDVVAVRIADERESKLPPSGQLWVVDPETGDEAFVDTESVAFKTWFSEWVEKRESDLKDLFRGARVEEIRIATRGDHADAVVRFFQARARFGRGALASREVPEVSQPIEKKAPTPRSSSRFKLFSYLVFSVLSLSAQMPAPALAQESRSSPSTMSQQPDEGSGNTQASQDQEGLENAPLVDIGWVDQPSGLLRVGDSYRVRLDGIPFQEGMRIEPPKGGRSLLEQGVAIVDPRLQMDPSNPKTAYFRMGVAAEGDIHLDPLKVVNPAGQVVGRTSPWVIPLVKGVLSDEEKASNAQSSAAQPRPPLDLAFPYWILFITTLLTVIVLALLGLLTWKKWKRWKAARANLTTIETPPQPEDLEALEAIARYRREDWSGPGRSRVLYFGLSDLVKRYAGRRWEFDAIESTTDEFLRSLQMLLVSKGDFIVRITQIFDRLDRVKFADQIPESGEPLVLFRGIEEFVLGTRRAPPVAPSDRVEPGVNHAP